MPPPIWLNTLEINRTQVTVAGETDQAAPLLKQIDASPFFEQSEFSMQPMRDGDRRNVSHPHESGGGEMNLSPGFRRALAWTLVSGVISLIWTYWQSSSPATVAVASTDSVGMAEKQLAKLREAAATVPQKQEILKQLSGDLALRERGIIIADTAQQAQAQIIQMLRKLGARRESPGGDPFAGVRRGAAAWAIFMARCWSRCRSNAGSINWSTCWSDWRRGRS